MITLADLEAYFDPAQPLPAGREIAPGVLADVPAKAYHDFRGLNSSLMQEHTAAEMWGSLNAPPSDDYATEAQAKQNTIGTLVHWALFEPFKFKDPYAYVLECPTKGLATQAAARTRLEHPDRLLVTAEILEEVHDCADSISLHPFAQQLIDVPCAREVSVFYFDPASEVWLKARFDLLPLATPEVPHPNYILDAKTTAFPPPQFPREARKHGYHFQGAWYLDVWESLTGERKEIYYLVAATKTAPFMTRVFDIQNNIGHLLYDDRHPFKQAREVLSARKATWITSAHETIAALKAGMTLTPSLTRSLWPAYEGDQPGSINIHF